MNATISIKGLAAVTLWALLTFFLTRSPAHATARIGLVLSGGGARGAAHVGVLKVLEELRIPIHAIAGTSMGALVGGAYASGVSAVELEKRVTRIDWNDLFTDDPPRKDWPLRRKQEADRPTWDFSIGRRDGKFRLPKGAIAGQKVQLFLSDLVQNAEGIDHYDHLPIPFRAIATNLENGKIKVFDDEPLAESLRASMSVPGLFAPLETESGIYVDGGLVRNLPVDIVRSMDVEVVIAVNLGSTYLKREQLGTILGVTGQMIAILTEQNVERSLTEIDPERDILISPDLGNLTAGDFNRNREAIAAGERAARNIADSLSRYSLDDAGYAEWRTQCLAKIPEGFETVDEVRFAELHHVNPGYFKQIKERHEGKPLDRKEVEADLLPIYGRGDFERVSYRVTRDNGGRLLMIDAVEKAWGPGYLSFGLGLSTDGEGDSRFGFRGTYRQTWINSLGADWTTSLTLGNAPVLTSEFYQPFNLIHPAFVAPYIDIGQSPMGIYYGSQRVARYDVTRYTLGTDFGVVFGNSVELRAGPYLKDSQFELDTGDPLFSEGHLVQSGVRARVLYDTLDNAHIPRSGMRFVSDYERPMAAFKADAEYDRLQGAWTGATSLRGHSLVANLRGGTAFNDTLAYYDQFALGGLHNLSGYANDQFRGNQLAYANLIYQWRLATLTPPLGRGIYMGGSLEFGRLWDVAGSDIGIPLHSEKNRYGSSIFASLDTWFGPLYLGYGIAAEGDSTIYVMLGRP